jgi:hypothetical protein
MGAVLALARPDVTALVLRGAARALTDLGYACVTEAPLANGRRADLVGIGPGGELVIVEVKSGIEDYRADRKWRFYEAFCDAFYFAVAPEFPEDRLPADPGLIVADRFGGAVLREPERHALAPARRKAMTLMLARLAAQRALRLTQPAPAPRAVFEDGEPYVADGPPDGMAFSDAGIEPDRSDQPSPDHFGDDVRQ